MLHKLYESNLEKETRYSPAKCNGTEKNQFAAALI
jgi:hypothetical protein